MSENEPTRWLNLEAEDEPFGITHGVERPSRTLNHADAAALIALLVFFLLMGIAVLLGLHDEILFLVRLFS